MNVMLAKEYNEKKHDVNNWFFSEKYDGVRGIYIHQDKKMYTRNGIICNLPDFIMNQLNDIGMDLDGEIWFGYDTFDLCSSLVRRTNKENDLDTWKTVKYMVFDNPYSWYPFESRIEQIKNKFKDKYLPNIQLIGYWKSNDSVKNELIEIEKKGGEGLMLRKPGSHYDCKRSSNMLKVKSWLQLEGMIIGYNNGKGKYFNMIGNVQVYNEDFGTFNVGTGLSDDERMMNDDIIGKIITIRYKEISKNGFPKMPSVIDIKD